MGEVMHVGNCALRANSVNYFVFLILAMFCFSVSQAIVKRSTVLMYNFVLKTMGL